MMCVKILCSDIPSYQISMICRDRTITEQLLEQTSLPSQLPVSQRNSNSSLVSQQFFKLISDSSIP